MYLTTRPPKYSVFLCSVTQIETVPSHGLHVFFPETIFLFLVNIKCVFPQKPTTHPKTKSWVKYHKLDMLPWTLTKHPDGFQLKKLPRRRWGEKAAIRWWPIRTPTIGWQRLPRVQRKKMGSSNSRCPVRMTCSTPPVFWGEENGETLRGCKFFYGGTKIEGPGWGPVEFDELISSVSRWLGK